MKQMIEQLFSKAGIQPNGTNPWDIQVHDDRFYDRLVQNRSLGAGESYMDGWWDCECLDELIRRLTEAKLDQELERSPKRLFQVFLHKLFNYQTKQQSKQVAERHYDLGNDLYQAMLDETMNYTCGYWKKATTLEEAQRDKLELICRKLMLKPGMRVLDVGCGFGCFSKYAAENYGVEVYGVTLSIQQQQLASKRCKGLPVTIKLQDYRDIPEGQFDRVAAIGILEHVGYKNYRQFMEIIHQHLIEDGIFLLHCIGGNYTTLAADPWIDKYIFPNGHLPYITQIGQAIEHLFVMEDWHNFGADYDKTLMAWHHNFNAHWPKLRDKYGERFFRMWNYYLLVCAGAFRARTMQLWQLVLTKNGIKGGFRARDI